jgi:hypothetical protein
MKFTFELNRKNATQTGSKRDKKRTSGNLVKQAPNRPQMQLDRLKSAVDFALDPNSVDRSELIEIYEGTSKDGHVISQLQVAENKLLSEPFLIINGETEDKEALKLFKKSWFDAFIKCALSAEFWGYQLIEFGPEHDEKLWEYVKVFPRLYVIPWKKKITFNLGGSGDVEYSDILTDLFLIELGEPEVLGKFEAVSKEVIWKGFSRSDWSEYNERFGKPLLDIACNTDDDDEVAAKIEMARNFGSNGYVVRDVDDQVNMISPQGSANGSQFEPLAKFCNDEISKIINGQTGTSDEKSFVGAAQVHERVLDDFTKGRLRAMQNIVNDTLIPFLVYHGWQLEGRTLVYPILEEESNTGKTEQQPIEGENGQHQQQVATKNQLPKKATGYPW